MLVLSRNIGEQVVIGGQITVTVVAIRGAQVRLGITAPAHVPIRREEVEHRLSAGPAGAGEGGRTSTEDGPDLA
jgi:carbon storage regulator